MRHWQFLAGALIAAMGVTLVAVDADARRLGGGAARGMQRAPAKTPPPQPPAQQAPAPQPPTQAQAARQGAAPAAAQSPAPRRSWIGPIAGLAAGLGLAALFSYLGLGAELANAVMLGLLLVMGFVVMRWLLRRMAGIAPSRALPAAAGAHGASVDMPARAMEPAATGGAGAVPPVDDGVRLPPGFDAQAFERAAKMIFVRMQAANDAADLAELRRFTTPEMLDAVADEMRQRPPKTQRTDVVQLDAQVLDFAHEGGQDVVSVRYRGLIREEVDGTAHPFDEVWHLVRPAEDQPWLLAGIQPHEG
ncbi:MAG: Tim44 domain-containing protein [Pseudomonadota bacterium]